MNHQLAGSDDDGEDQLSEEKDDKGGFRTVGRAAATTSRKTLPKIKLKVQPNADDIESEEEMERRPSTSTRTPAPPSRQKPHLGGKTTMVKAKAEVISVRVCSLILRCKFLLHYVI